MLFYRPLVKGQNKNLPVDQLFIVDATMCRKSNIIFFAYENTKNALIRKHFP